MDYGFDDDDETQTLVSHDLALGRQGSGEKRGGGEEPCGGGAPAAVEHGPPPPTAKQNARKKKLAAGEKMCAGCDRSLPLADYPQNSRFCLADKRALHNVAKLAKKEGEESVQWLSEARKTDRGVKQLLRSYYAAVQSNSQSQPSSAAGGRKKTGSGAWSVASAIESFSATRGMDIIEEGEVMTKSEFLAHSLGKGRNMEDACKMWKDLEDNPETPRLQRNGILQLRVVTALKMNRRETLSVTKETVVQEKQLKKARSP